MGDGATAISLIPRDPRTFYNHLLLSGFRVCQGGADIQFLLGPDGGTITASGPGCTGYILDADGLEVSETDFFRFLARELGDGETINIFGEYAITSGQTIRSMAHFRCQEGSIMSSEERTLIRSDGSIKVLQKKSDINYENIVSFPASKSQVGLSW